MFGCFYYHLFLKNFYIEFLIRQCTQTKMVSVEFWRWGWLLEEVIQFFGNRMYCNNVNISFLYVVRDRPQNFAEFESTSLKFLARSSFFSAKYCDFRQFKFVSDFESTSLWKFNHGIFSINLLFTYKSYECCKEIMIVYHNICFQLNQNQMINYQKWM